MFLLNVSLNEASVEPEQTLQDLDTFPMLSSQQQLTEKTEVEINIIHIQTLHMCRLIRNTILFTVHIVQGKTYDLTYNILRSFCGGFPLDLGLWLW